MSKNVIYLRPMGGIRMSELAKLYNFPTKPQPLTAEEIEKRFEKARSERSKYVSQALEQEVRHDQQSWFYDGDIDTDFEWPKRTRLQKVLDGFVTTVAIGAILFGIMTLAAVIEWWVF